MPNSLITTAKGTLMQLSDVSSPPTYASISQVRSITGPTTKPKIQDITTHDTPGFWARKLTTLVEAGEISFEINYSPYDATHAFATGLWNQMAGLTLSAFNMVFPNSFGTMASKGYVAGHEFTVPIDNVLAAKITLALTDNISTTNPVV